jgi:proline racemase
MQSAKTIRPRAGVRDLLISDISVGGDIHRIILNGIATSPGRTAREVRALIIERYDALRRMLLNYPYGNEDMCADLIFPSNLEEGAYAYVVMECMGYPYFSGSNTMASIAGLIEYGLAPLEEGTSPIRIEAPSGMIDARYRIADGRIEEVCVRGDDAYVIADDLSVEVPGFGSVAYALVWSGAPFIMLRAADFGIEVTPEHLDRMKQVGRAVVEAIRPGFAHIHPEIGSVEAPGFIHYMGELEEVGEEGFASRGATYGFPATVFVCPTGTGTAARMALEVARGRMRADSGFENSSPAGHPFVGRGLGFVERGGTQMLAAEIAAKPYVLATTTMHLDFGNPVMATFEEIGALLDG